MKRDARAFWIRSPGEGEIRDEELPELLLEPLDPHFRVAVIGLLLTSRATLLRTLPGKRELRGRGLHGRSQHHGDRRGAGSVKESG